MPPAVVVDTSALLAFFDASEPDHDAVSELLAKADVLVVSPYVVPSWTTSSPPDTGWMTSWLCSTNWPVERGTWQLSTKRGFAARQVIASYRDQKIAVADASIVVLAERYRTRTIASLDHRHFDVLRSLDGGSFEVLPRRS